MNLTLTDTLVRLSLGLPDPGRDRADNPVLTAAVRSVLGVDAHQAGQDLRMAEVVRSRHEEQTQERPASQPERTEKKQGPTRSL